MIHYAAFQNFLWLWLVPALAAALLYGAWRRRRAMAAFIGSTSVHRLAGELGLLRIWTKAGCVVAVVALVVFALAQPQWGTYRTQTRASGRDILVALDVSRSMLAEDVTPSRLERAKTDIRDLVAAVEESGGHRLGLIAFAGSAGVKCPLTQVTSHFKLVLDGLGPRSVSQGGTLIGDCIRAAIEAFDDKTQNFRDLILISDGEDMDSFPLDAAAAAREAGVTIYTVGVGDPVEGARVPVRDKAGRASYLEHNGEVVWSKLHEDALRQIAQITGGIYVPAGTRAIELDRIFREKIEPKTKRDLGETQRERLHHRFQWFLAAAVLLLFVESLTRETRRRSASSPVPFDPEANRREQQAQTRPRQALLPLLLVGVAVATVVPANDARADDARSLVRDGNRMYEEGKYSEAAQLYEQAAQLASDSAVPLYNRAAALFQSGDFAAAAKLYEQARARAPEDLRPQINYALGNCHLQQALRSQAQPAQASPEAKAAVDFYHDAISSSPASANAAAVRDAARHNLELTKRLIQQLEQRQQQQPQPRQDGDQQQPKDQQNQQNSDPTNQGGQDKQSPDRPQPSDPSPPQDQQQPSDSSDGRSPQKAGSARDQLSPDEAAERLHAAIARAQLARARRLNDQDKRAKGKAVERDW